MENVIMMVNNAGHVFQLRICIKRKQKLHNLQRSKPEPVQINMCVIFLDNNILNDSHKYVV